MATEEAAAAIRRQDERFNELFAAQDAQGLAGLYTADGMLLPPGAARARGRDAIAAFWRSEFDRGVRRCVLAPQEIESFGDTAHELGVATLTIATPDGEIHATGDYVVLWKRAADGTWQLHRDIWNPNP
jgi:uncharacterized protein (TIGR02246 family)